MYKRLQKLNKWQKADAEVMSWVKWHEKYPRVPEYVYLAYLYPEKGTIRKHKHY